MIYYNWLWDLKWKILEKLVVGDAPRRNNIDFLYYQSPFREYKI